MRLEVLKPNGIVSDAFIEESELSFSLFINTKEKWRDYDGYGISFFDDVAEFEFDYFPEDVSDNPDTVKLIAENEHDLKILDRVHFNLHDKTQAWILFVDKSVYK